MRVWCESRVRPLAWITLDVGDNDPVRFWTYVATAVDRVCEGLGHGALRRLGSTGGAIDAPIDELMNGLDALPHDLVIVLDDLQTVTDEECLASIDYALEHLPPTARLIAISRADPALRLARRRAAGALVELRADDLAFTMDEARRLVVDDGRVDLGVEEVRTLHKRTEGWPAALLLASIWLRTVDDPRRAVRTFGGGHRFVADYLSQEVLASLDDDTRAFLLSAWSSVGSPQSSATACFHDRTRHRSWRSSSVPICSLPASSTVPGIAFTRCWRSSRRQSSRRWSPPRRRRSIDARASG